MVQFYSVEVHDNVLQRVLTTTYKSGAQSKRLLDSDGIPVDMISWVPAKKFEIAEEDVIDSVNLMLGEMMLDNPENYGLI